MPEETVAVVEKALTGLGLQFAWEDDELFILDSEKLTGSPLHIKVLVREGSLQISTLLLQNPSSEQIGVAAWQEWMRRGEASFCMIDEEDGETSIVLAVRIPLYALEQKEVTAATRAGLYALARSYELRRNLFQDVEASV